MGKLRLASPEVEKLIQDVAQEMGLIQQGLEFQALCTTKSKIYNNGSMSLPSPRLSANVQLNMGDNYFGNDPRVFRKMF